MVPKKNLTVLLKLILLFRIALCLFLISSIISGSMLKQIITLDGLIDSIEGTYAYTYDIHIRFLREFYRFEDRLYKIEEATKLFNEKSINKYLIEDKWYYSLEEIKKLKNYSMSLPTINEIEIPQLESIIIQINSGLSEDDKSSAQYKLVELYNGNACDIIFAGRDSEYPSCLTYWNGVLTKGMQQSISQMEIEFNFLRKEFIELNSSRIDIYKFLDGSRKFFDFGAYVSYYFYEAYAVTVQYCLEVRDIKINNYLKVFDYSIFGYVAACFILYLLFIFTIFSIHKIFEDFLCFLSVFPYKYLATNNKLIAGITDMKAKILF